MFRFVRERLTILQKLSNRFLDNDGKYAQENNKERLQKKTLSATYGAAPLTFVVATVGKQRGWSRDV